MNKRLVHACYFVLPSSCKFNNDSSSPFDMESKYESWFYLAVIHDFPATTSMLHCKRNNCLSGL